jgi:hypothetical protein
MEGSMLMERASELDTIQKMRNSETEFGRMAGMFGGGPPSSSGWSGSGDWLEEAEDVAKDNAQKMIFGWESFMWHTSWSYSDELKTLQGDQIILDALRAAKTIGIFYQAYTNMTAQLTIMGITNLSEDSFLMDAPDLRWLFSSSISGLGNAVRKTMAAEASKRIVITAIALKRFQLEHGNFPEKISELVPEFLPVAPLDPVDGQPLRYRRRCR